MALLPRYFYDINAVMPNGRMRWFDEFANVDSKHIVTLDQLNINHYSVRNQRNMAYARWLASFCAKGPDGSVQPMIRQNKMMKWQAIRVLAFKHSEESYKDWWEDYQDATFRVFLEPETCYDEVTGEHKQWYLLCPEDSYLVNAREMEKKGTPTPVRDWNGRERHLPLNRELRKARLIPVECCHHLRHETVAGALPEGL